MIQFKIDADKLPKADDLKTYLFASTLSVTVSDQDIRFVSRGAFPNLAIAGQPCLHGVLGAGFKGGHGWPRTIGPGPSRSAHPAAGGWHAQCVPRRPAPRSRWRDSPAAQEANAVEIEPEIIDRLTH